MKGRGGIYIGGGKMGQSITHRSPTGGEGGGHNVINVTIPTSPHPAPEGEWGVSLISALKVRIRC